MNDVERLARLEEQVNHLRNLLKWSALGLAALLGANNFFLIPRAAAAEVRAQMTIPVKEEIELQSKEQIAAFVKKAERWAADAEKGAGAATASASGAAASASNAARSEAAAQRSAGRIEALAVNDRELLVRVRVLAGATWGALGAVDSALDLLVRQRIAVEVERFRTPLGDRRNEIASEFSFPANTPYDTNPGLRR